jgi:hypothetical protein
MSASLNVQMLSFAALGAFALWMRLEYGSNFQGGVDKFINEIADNFRVRMLFRLVIFVIFGALLSVIMVEPVTEKQALAAGMAWTTLLGGAVTLGSRRGRTGASTPQQ